MKSIYRLPSTSSAIAPDPPAMTSGYSLIYDVEVHASSRAMIACPLGPGE